MARVLITDLNDTYPEDMEDVLKSCSGDDTFLRISMKDIPGRNMYVSDEALDEIGERLSGLDAPWEGIHFIDTGNYHYMSYVFASSIPFAYDLVLIDNHTDMQDTAFGDMLSCGSWAGKLLRGDKNLRTLTVIGPAVLEAGGRDVRIEGEPDTVTGDPGRAFTGRVYEGPGYADAAGSGDVPLYISVDKDILDPCECITNWDQGDVTASELKGLIKSIASGVKVAGADICGGISMSDPGFCDRALALNLRSDIFLYEVLREVTG